MVILASLPFVLTFIILAVDPAVTLRTPVFVIVRVPDVVIGLPETLIPAPADAATLVTVPTLSTPECVLTLPSAMRN